MSITAEEQQQVTELVNHAMEVQDPMVLNVLHAGGQLESMVLTSDEELTQDMLMNSLINYHLERLGNEVDIDEIDAEQLSDDFKTFVSHEYYKALQEKEESTEVKKEVELSPEQFKEMVSAFKSMFENLDEDSEDDDDK